MRPPGNGPWQLNDSFHYPLIKTCSSPACCSGLLSTSCPPGRARGPMCLACQRGAIKHVGLFVAVSFPVMPRCCCSRRQHSVQTWEAGGGCPGKTNKLFTTAMPGWAGPTRAPLSRLPVGRDKGFLRNENSSDERRLDLGLPDITGLRQGLGEPMLAQWRPDRRQPQVHMAEGPGTAQTLALGSGSRCPPVYMPVGGHLHCPGSRGGRRS